jgi:hypothetical protein
VITAGAASAALCVSIALAAPALAAGGAGDADATAPGTRLEVGVVIGGIALDPHLQDYRWDTAPSLQSGAHATVLRGRFGAGARLWRSSTTQASGIPGEEQAPRVNMTGLEMTGQVRALAVRGVELWGSAHGGRLFLGYDPESLTFDVGGQPVTVSYQPVAEWEYGVGAALRGELGPHMALALQADLTSFSLDTAHRRGDEIVEARERFSTWDLRAQVSWVFGLK